MIVYKYLPASRFDVLEDSRIRFTQPAALNDPYETLPCFIEYAQGLIDQIHQQAVDKFGLQAAEQSLNQRPLLVAKKLLETPKTLSKYFVILSLSKICDNSLMWSHYADSHRGFVIGFDASNYFFKPGNGKANDGLEEVRYSNKRHIVPNGGYKSLDDPNLRKANSEMFFTKSLDWSYEQEMRILAHPKSADVTLPSTNEFDICLFNFPKDSVKEVIFGFRMSESDRHRLFDLVKLKYPPAKIRISVIHESEFQFRIATFTG